ncbi:MAG: AbrB/MazE/SpoVT family DNA-binding domain-containing protein [Anaerolineae bacterium]|nr:AbrB/MazE/SpoVT family DNA-binding domain-containing protein [Anaerolineae bacterium]
MEVLVITTVRVQEKGQVTIPQRIRRQLNLKRGDLVTFVTTEQGVLIKTLEMAIEELFEALRKSLETRGIHLESVLERVQTTRADALTREFGLTISETEMLYQALQLKAQLAVETIRSSTKSFGLDQITDEEIEAEIRAARKR